MSTPEEVAAAVIESFSGTPLELWSEAELGRRIADALEVYHQGRLREALAGGPAAEEKTVEAIRRDNALYQERYGPAREGSWRRQVLDLLGIIDVYRARAAALEGLLEDRHKDEGLLDQEALPGGRARARVRELEEALARLVEAEEKHGLCGSDRRCWAADPCEACRERMDEALLAADALLGRRALPPAHDERTNARV